jgi:general stress protein 26
MDNTSLLWNAGMRKLGELIKGIDVAMLTTMDESGYLHSRPMATQRADFDGDLWFFTKLETAKVHEIDQDQRVNVSYADVNAHRFISVSGGAKLVADAKKAEELWSPLLKTWFPDGPRDPSLRLVKVQVEHAEYWDAPAGQMAVIAGFVRASITGQATEPGKLGENKKLDLAG